MTRGGVAGSVRRQKEAHPERFCPVRNCLWNTAKEGGGYCPRHAPRKPLTQDQLAAVMALPDKPSWEREA